MTTTSDVVVVGAGIIGTAVAWRCAQRGLSVTIVDPEPERGAWYTAAGMLAPVTESHFTETPLLRLNLDSLRRYPSFVGELTELTGLPTGYRECGTLAVAWDGADHAALRDLHGFLSRLGIGAELLSTAELRALEPALAAGLPGGLLAADDHQVDPRLLRACLLEAAVRCGATVHRGTATLRQAGSRVVGVSVTDGRDIDAATTVLAAGAWSGVVSAGILDTAVRPVKGQTIRLRLPSLPLQHIVRATVKGNPVYVVPRGNGEVIVGASSDDAGFDQLPRAGAVYELLRDAQSVLPELSESVLDEICTGLRPGSPDNAPLVGDSGVDGLLFATGHYRNGVLLAPVTADGIAQLIVHSTVPDVLAPFAPGRMSTAVGA
jgi:glycine oxidase